MPADCCSPIAARCSAAPCSSSRRSVARSATARDCSAIGCVTNGGHCRPLLDHDHWMTGSAMSGHLMNRQSTAWRSELVTIDCAPTGRATNSRRDSPRNDCSTFGTGAGRPRETASSTNVASCDVDCESPCVPGSRRPARTRRCKECGGVALAGGPRLVSLAASTGGTWPSGRGATGRGVGRAPPVAQSRALPRAVGGGPAVTRNRVAPPNRDHRRRQSCSASQPTSG